MPATSASYRPHVGVHLILAADGKVLLLRRANTGFADGSWSVPGGCLDEGETLPAAAAREAREELGITIDPAGLAFAHLCHHADPDGQARIGKCTAGFGVLAISPVPGSALAHRSLRGHR